MKILVIGGGGREHAIVWKIAQSPRVKKIYCTPGNAGIADLAVCVSIRVENIDKLVIFAKEKKIDLTIVGPEASLVAGIVDVFEKEGLKIFGATKNAAQIESSKSFAKNLMNKYQIPTPAGKTFTSYKKAENYIRKIETPLVVKADGLAAGKGVIVCNTEKEALDALNQIMIKRSFGDAGKKVIVEERIYGEEVSFLVFTDGKTVLPLPSSQDHKAIFDNDKGPNTGGMGAYSPAPVVDRILYKKIISEIMEPVVRAMASEGCPYKGVLYAGLMINNDKISVLEFNARFGDPETQPLLIRMKNDIIPIMEAVIEGKLDGCRLDIDKRASVCVVMAAKGYPGSYKKGLPISGLKDVKRMKDVVIFHSGTTIIDQAVAANGGRVLGVTALGDSIKKAITKAYKAASKITWTNEYYRKDIGQKALIMLAGTPEVGIVMGSDSDLEIMDETAAILKKFGIRFELTVASAHRSPVAASEFASSARKKGIKVIIAGAGHAAHLAGVMAANTSLPVIGVPIDSSALNGFDALLATVQMPPGVPVATMAIGKPGARNAGILAAQILSVSDNKIRKRLEEFKINMAAQVEQKAKKIDDFG